MAVVRDSGAPSALTRPPRRSAHIERSKSTLWCLLQPHVWKRSFRQSPGRKCALHYWFPGLQWMPEMAMSVRVAKNPSGTMAKRFLLSGREPAPQTRGATNGMRTSSRKCPKL